MAWFTLEAIDGRRLLERLAREDAIALPLIPEAARARLLAEQAGYAYLPSREVVGSGPTLVRQQLDWFADFPEGSAFTAFTTAFQALWDAAMAPLNGGGFATPLNLNEMMLNRYEVGSIGITPHRDHISYRNLVVLLVLEGEGLFRVAAARSGQGARAVPAPPGHAIFMRAPGFPGFGDDAGRPFHYVAEITRRRTVFGLRQEEPPGARAARTAARTRIVPERS